MAFFSHVEALCIGFHPILQRGVEKFKRGAAIPHLNKELFYNLPIGIPPLAEQQRITERINELSQLLK